jgi:phage shock protein PspC (stress-responsive transcriptional regulator)
MERDTENGILFGVCAGLGNHFDIDVFIIRALFVTCTLLGVGLPILLYFVLALCMPAAE